MNIDREQFVQMVQRAKLHGQHVRVFRSQLQHLARIGVGPPELEELGITVMDDENLGAADTVVCLAADRILFPDNLITACAWCGTMIQHRPNIPNVARKICLGCARAELDAPLN